MGDEPTSGQEIRSLEYLCISALSVLYRMDELQSSPAAPAGSQVGGPILRRMDALQSSPTAPAGSQVG
eukprot:546239-Karenia_brevis.AAC.1